MTDPFPYLGRGIVKNRAVWLAAERQYKCIETAKGSTVTRTGRGSDFEVQGIFAVTSRLVDVKTGKAVLSPLQRSLGAEAVHMDPKLNAALAAGVGLSIGVAVAETVRYFVGDHVRLICQTCGTETTMKERLCPSCDSPLPRTGEFWIGVGLAGTGVTVLVLSLLTLSLNLPLVLIAAALLGAGIDLIFDSLRADIGRPAPTTGSSV